MSNEQEGWEPWRPMRPTLAIRSPVPLKPPPLSRMNYEPGDIVSPSNTKQEHSNFCHELRARSGGFYNAGPLRRVCTAHRREAALDHHFFPARSGASNWGEAAADPSLDYIFVNSSEKPGIGWMEKEPEGSPVLFDRNSVGPMSRFHWSEGNPRIGKIPHSGEQRGLARNRRGGD